MTFKRANASQEATSFKKQKYMLIDEDTDDDDFRKNASPKDGVWINVNDLPEPFYELKEYKPIFKIPDEDINEDSSTGYSVFLYYNFN